jgi:hypothetical protein
LFVPYFIFFFSQAVTSSLFIFSVVHSVFLLLKSNQTILAEWLFVMQSSAGRRVVCSARGGFSRVCYAGTLYPSNEGNPLVFWWIAVTRSWQLPQAVYQHSRKLFRPQPSTVHISLFAICGVDSSRSDTFHISTKSAQKKLCLIVVLRCYQEAVMKQKKLRAERRFFF